MTKLKIAIDFDDTFTADVKTWSKVIEVLQLSGHTVICVSARSESDGNRRELTRALPHGVEVLLSEHHQKSTFAQSRGHHVDIWIDDIPSAIPTDYELRQAIRYSMTELEYLKQSPEPDPATA